MRNNNSDYLIVLIKLGHTNTSWCINALFFFSSRNVVVTRLTPPHVTKCSEFPQETFSRVRTFNDKSVCSVWSWVVMLPQATANSTCFYCPPVWSPSDNGFCSAVKTGWKTFFQYDKSVIKPHIHYTHSYLNQMISWNTGGNIYKKTEYVMRYSIIVSILTGSHRYDCLVWITYYFTRQNKSSLGIFPRSH